MVLHADYLQPVGQDAFVIADRRYLQLGVTQRGLHQQAVQTEQRPLCEGSQGILGYRRGSFKNLA